jgi:hypothetical protein
MSKHSDNDEPRAEYDFSGGERGRYAKRLAEGSNIVVLEPEVAAAFPDSDSVNKALRQLMNNKHAG